MPNISITGINHTNCPLDILEKANVTASNLSDFYKQLGLEEAVFLQTCNRREIIHTGPKISKAAFAELFGIKNEDGGKYIVSYEGIEAVRHLFRTAAGLNSAMPGETQILGQVRTAYIKSKEFGASGIKLEKFFSAAICAARAARFESGISNGAVSAAQAAVIIAASRMDLKGKKTLIIGAGKINSTAVMYLKKAGAIITFVAGRSQEKAKKLADVCGAEAIDFSLLHEAVEKAGLIISATSAPHYVLRMDNVFEAVNNRKDKLLIIDLAVPRDVDPKLSCEKVEIINMDDINAVTLSNISKRHEAAKVAGTVIDKLARRWIDEIETRNKEKSFGSDTGKRINRIFQTLQQQA